jgi:YVTN family beta-propeller protein
LTVDADGAFTYTPTQLTRLNAGSTLPVDFDSFSVDASDGQATTNVPVNVQIYSGTIKPAGLDALGNLTDAGTIPVGGGPTAMATHGSLIYVANTAENTVAVLDTTTGSVLNTFGVAAAPNQLAVSPDGGTLYVANSGSNLVSIHDTSTGMPIGFVPVAAPYGLALNPAGSRLYVSSIITNEVTVLDTATGQTVGRIPVGVTPVGVTVNGAGTRVYVANRGSGTVSTIDAVTNSVIATTPVGSLPQQVALSADGRRLYVANSGSGTVSVVDTNTFANFATVPVGPAPNGITLSRDGSVAYVVNGDNTVSVINTATNTKVTGTVHIDTGPLGWVAVSPDGGSLYVSNSVGNTLRTMSLVHLEDPPPVTGNPGATAGSEDFDGPAGSVPNPNLISYELGAGGDGALQAFTDNPHNASLDGNGNLVITAIKETVTDPFGGTWDYTSAALNTRDKFEFTYGTLSARIQFPAGQGLHPTFWMVGSDLDTVGWPNNGEIDIFEQYNSATGSALHGPGYYGISAPAQVNVDGEFHDFWVTWEPDKITTGIDGTTTAVFTPDSLPPGTPWTYNDRSMYVILSLAVGGPDGPPDDTVFPASVVVDSISYTPLPSDSAPAQSTSV